MKWIKKYLEKKRQEKEKRKQEQFLNTRISLDNLFFCKLMRMVDDGNTYYHFTVDSLKILKRLDRRILDYDYIDPVTNTKYKDSSRYYCLKNGEIATKVFKTINFTKEVLVRQYVTIDEIIKINKQMNT